MAAVVGVQIHHHKTELPAEKDQAAGIVLVFCRRAEKTLPVLILFAFGDRSDVLRAPRREKAFHDFLSDLS